MTAPGDQHDLSERELPHLRRWRDSRSVRVGNGAWNQRQVDVYGELLSAAYRLFEQLNPDHPGATAWREFLVACADTQRSGGGNATRASGGTGPAAALLYSKLMCWVALDRAIALAPPDAGHHRGRRGAAYR